MTLSEMEGKKIPKNFHNTYTHTENGSVNLKLLLASHVDEQHRGASPDRVSRSHVQRSSQRTHRSTRFSKAWTRVRFPGGTRRPRCRRFRALFLAWYRARRGEPVGTERGSPAASMLGRFRRGSAPLSSTRARAPLFRGFVIQQVSETLAGRRWRRR